MTSLLDHFVVSGDNHTEHLLYYCCLHGSSSEQTPQDSWTWYLQYSGRRQGKRQRVFIEGCKPNVNNLHHQFDAAESFVQISRLLLYYSNRMLVLVRIGVGVGLRRRNGGTSPASMIGSCGYVELCKMCWFVTFALTKGY